MRRPQQIPQPTSRKRSTEDDDFPLPPPRSGVTSRSEDGWDITSDARDVRLVCQACDRRKVFSKQDKDDIEAFKRNHLDLCTQAAS